MEFDVESDPDTLFELFGEDARAFAEYVSHIAISGVGDWTDRLVAEESSRR